jgi:hypothetical protein
VLNVLRTDIPRQRGDIHRPAVVAMGSRFIGWMRPNGRASRSADGIETSKAGTPTMGGL